MGDCQCSNIAIMQLFHELKQQFPTLPDHVVSQCIAQNSHDKIICVASLRQTEKSLRPFFGSFPPTAINNDTATIISTPLNVNNINTPVNIQNRPVSLNVSELSQSQQRPYYSHKRRLLPPLPPLDAALTSNIIQSQAPPYSVPPVSYSMQKIFNNIPSGIIDKNKNLFVDNKNNNNSSALTPTTTSTTGFNVNVNVACSPATPVDNSDFAIRHNIFSRTPLNGECIDELIHSSLSADPHTRSFTSVSLTLRPPTSEPQPPINIRSQGSSLTYSTSSSDPRGFQSRLQISIGPTSGNLGSISTGRMHSTGINNNLQQSSHFNSIDRQSVSTTQLPHENITVDTLPQIDFATTIITPTIASTNVNDDSCFLNASCTNVQSKFLTPSNTTAKKECISSINKPTPIDLTVLALNDVTDDQRKLLKEQLIRKEKLANELQCEEGKLAVMKKELEKLSNPLDPAISLQKLEKKLRSEIYQLRLECNLLANEVDKRSDPTVPFGETNEEFYKSIYTGQAVNLPAFTASSALPSVQSPPALPSTPPAWIPSTSGIHQVNNDENKDGPSWICEMCTFDNHPLMDTCEQCDMPRFPSLKAQGETQDIHIRVTHHHNFSPRSKFDN